MNTPQRLALGVGIVKAVPSEYQAWLKEQLNYSNELRLLERLTQLLQIADDVISPLVDSHEGFAKRVKDTRNYFTHYDERLKDKALGDLELHWHTEIVSLLIQRCFLRDLELTSEQCVKLFQRYRYYQHVLSHATK